MNVELRHHTPLEIASEAIRTAWDSGDKSDSEKDWWQCRECLWEQCGGEAPFDVGTGFKCQQCGSFKIQYVPGSIGKKDRELIHRVGNKFKHSSTLEHLVYNFKIEGISRATLQELARHRIASITVKSTRYTIKELKNKIIMPQNVHEWCVIPPGLSPVQETKYRNSMVSALGDVVWALKEGLSNDKVKSLIPESYKTELFWTINARSLQNFLSLRTDKSAYWEIRELARAVYNAIPDDHKYLFDDFVK